MTNGQAVESVMRRVVWLGVLLLLCACGGTVATPRATPSATRPRAGGTVSTGAATPATAVAASPRRAASPTASAPAQVVQGTGNAMSAPVTLPEGLGFVRFTQPDQGHFTVDLIAADGRPVQLTVVEGSGARLVPGAFSVARAGAYTFNVRATGPWSIAVTTPTDAEMDQAQPLPVTFSGQGSGITPFFTAQGRGIGVAVGYRGTGDLRIFLTDGAVRTDVYAGPGPMVPEPSLVEIPGGCTCVFLVDADGPWTITVTPP
jgi:hypothetical protein